MEQGVAEPEGLDMVMPEDVPGWTLSTLKQGDRTVAVTWKGGPLAADKSGVFTVMMMMLPAKEGRRPSP